MKRLLRNKSTGERFIQDTSTGEMRPATDEEIGQIVPNGQGINYRKQGVKNSERFVLKNLTKSPAAAREYLRSRGYYVMSLDGGGGYNFAVQKSQRDPQGNYIPPDPGSWGVVDPRGGADFLKDILDFTGDVGVGAVAAAGGALAGGATLGLAGLGGLAAGGAAGEAGRQLLGSAAGVPDNIDPTQIALSGGLSAALPAAGKGIGGVMKKLPGGAGELAESFGARFSGIAGKAHMTQREILRRAARLQPEAKKLMQGAESETLKDPMHLVGAIRASLKKLGEPTESEKVALSFIDEASDAPQYDISAIVRKMRAVTKESGLTTERIRAKLPQSVLDKDEAVDEFYALQVLTEKIKGTLNLADDLDAPVMRSVRDLYELKRTFQQYAAKKGAYGGGARAKTPIARQVAEAARGVNQRLNDAIKREFPDRFSEWSFHSKKYAEQVMNLGKMRKLFDGDGAEKNLLSIFDKGNTERLTTLRDFDRLFKSDLIGEARKHVDYEELARNTVAAGVVDPSVATFGRAPMIPKLTATGNILGVSAIGGGLGFAQGGDTKSALVGAAAGAYLASPRTIMMMSRAAQKVGRLPYAPSSERSVAKTMTQLERSFTSDILPPAKRAAALSMFHALGRQLMPDDNRPVSRYEAKRNRILNGR